MTPEDPDVKSERSSAAVLQYLKLLFEEQGRRLVVSFSLGLLVSLTSGVGLIMLIPMLELLGVSSEASRFPQLLETVFAQFGAKPSLSGVLSLFVALVVCQALLQQRHKILNARLELSFGESLQNRLFNAVVRSDWLFFVQRRNSDFSHAITKNIERVTQGTFYFLRLTASILIAAAHMMLTIAISPLLAAITLPCFVVMAVLLGRQNRAALRSGDQLLKHGEEYYADVADQLSGMKESKILGSEERGVESFQKATAAMRSAYMRYMRAESETTMFYAIGAATLLAVLLYSSVSILTVPLAELLTLVFIFSRLTPRIREIHASYQGFLHMLPSLQATLMLQQECDAARERLDPTCEEHLTIQRELSLRNVGFRYAADQETWAVHEANVSIPARCTTAIVGPSGSGKSTLADLLLGLLSPEEGEILLDDQPLDTGQLSAWRRSVGYVPQSTFLLHDTIRANLLWGSPDALESDMQEAIKSAAADDFIETSQDGLDTIVGDRGERLSGGQRQRIALARALLRKPSVLVLDEATSSIDPENQRRIQEAIQHLHGELTIILIAHHMATVRNADQILVMDQGRIVEQGTHDELIGRKNGKFRALADAEHAVEILTKVEKRDQSPQ
jgi:ATP-binding cassette, subfamily C, bacterial